MTPSNEPDANVIPISYAKGRRYAVLRAIAESDNSPNKYRILKDLPRKIGSKPTLLKVIDELKADKFIRVHHVDRQARGNVGYSEHYDLALRGFVDLVDRVTNSTPDKDSSIAAMKPLKERTLLKRIFLKYHGFLPAIFELWPSFVDVDMEEEAWFRLGRFCGFLGAKLRTEELSEDRKKQLSKFVNEDGVNHVLLLWTFDVWDRTYEKEWFEAIHKKKVLREVAVKLLRGQVDKMHREQTQLASMEKDLQGLVSWLQKG